jgi:hypothetical protein
VHTHTQTRTVSGGNFGKGKSLEIHLGHIPSLGKVLSVQIRAQKHNDRTSFEDAKLILSVVFFVAKRECFFD